MHKFQSKCTDQKPGDHPNYRKNALGVKRPFSELSESSGIFSEQLSEFEIPFSEYEIPFSEWHPTTRAIRKPQFSEQLPERFPELTGTRMKDFHLPLLSRSVFSRIGVVPARKNRGDKNFPIRGRKKQGQPETWQDSTFLVSTRKSGNFFHILGRCPFNLKLHRKPGEKGQESTGKKKKSNGDGALKLQISVPCRGRTRPDQCSHP